MIVSLLAGKANRDHKKKPYYREKNNRRAEAHTDLFADKQCAKQSRNAHARTAEQSADGHKCIALVDIICHRRYHAVNRNVTNRIARIPKQISYHKPYQLARLCHTARNYEQKNRSNRNKSGGNTNPRHTFLLVFEFNFIENYTKHRVVHGVPNLDNQRNKSDFAKVNSVHHQIGCHECRYNIIENILSDKIRPVAHTLAELSCIIGRRDNFFNLHAIPPLYNYTFFTNCRQ